MASDESANGAGSVVGMTLPGYRVTAVLESSGATPLLRATRVADSRSVVLKVLELGNEADANDLFVATGANLMRLDAAQAHRVRDTFGSMPGASEDRGHRSAPLAVQPLELWPLDELVARYGPPDVAETVSIVAELVRALVLPHAQGLSYGAIRPEEVLCAHDDVSMLCVFRHGFHEAASHTEESQTDAEQAAPERHSNNGEERAADLTALAALLYELLTGVPPDNLVGGHDGAWHEAGRQPGRRDPPAFPAQSRGPSGAGRPRAASAPREA